MSSCSGHFDTKKRVCTLVLQRVSVEEIAAIGEFLKKYRGEHKNG